MRVRVGDVRLFFEVEGAKLAPDGSVLRERPTILLLHGGPGGDHAGLRPFGAKLADLAQVVYLDHRGNGRSDRSGPATWRLERWADDVRGFCDALEIQRPIVMGVSFGGYVALAYAARHPEHPSKLILAGTAARFRVSHALAAFERLGGARAADVARRFFADPMSSFEEYVGVCLPLYRRSPPPAGALRPSIVNLEVGGHFVAGEMQTFDLRAKIGRVRCPTLVLSGGHDPIAAMEDAEELVAALPPGNVRFERFPEAGHEVLDDAADGCLRAIREFVAKPWLPGAGAGRRAP
jgi:proline iminopeptidase